MIDLFVGDFYDADFESIKDNPLYENSDEDLINAFLDELQTTEHALWALTQWKADSSNPHFNICAIASMQESGFNIYRIRPLSRRLKKYRILYAYNGQRDEVYLLAVVVKKPDQIPQNISHGEYYDYEREHRITLRVLDEYDRLGLPKCH